MADREPAQNANERVMSDQLRAIVDADASNAIDNDGQPTQSGVYNATMGRLLADRIGNRRIGPEQYSLELSYLCDDAQRGVSQYTQERLPASVSGYDARPFISTAIGYARRAFGDEFGDRLLELNFGREYLERVQRDRAKIARLREQS